MKIQQIIPAAAGHTLFTACELANGEAAMVDKGPVIAWGTDDAGSLVPMVPSFFGQEDDWWVMCDLTRIVITSCDDIFFGVYEKRMVNGFRVLVRDTALDDMETTEGASK
jgi:hypothetical protein